MKLLLWPIIILNVLCSIGFLFSGFSYMIPPAEHPTLALANFSFPFFAVGVIAFMILWLLIGSKYALISIATLVVGYVPMNKYAPLNFQDESETTDALKIVSYNVHMFSPTYSPNDTVNFLKALDYFKSIDADIMCLQEATLTDYRLQVIKERFNYVDSHEDKAAGTGILCISKYPIIKVEPINYESESNGSACFYVKYKGQTLRIINNHLESIRFEIEDKEKFKSYVKSTLKNGFEDEESLKASKRMATYIRKAAAHRQPQAETVAKFIGDNAKNTIVVGDFNDTPLSYIHYLMDQKLTDCYAKRGCLMGFSYTDNGMFVRIDHSFCSEDFKVTRCYVDNNIEISDHYPLITCLVRQ